MTPARSGTATAILQRSLTAAHVSAHHVVMLHAIRKWLGKSERTSFGSSKVDAARSARATGFGWMKTVYSQWRQMWRAQPRRKSDDTAARALHLAHSMQTCRYGVSGQSWCSDLFSTHDVVHDHRQRPTPKPARRTSQKRHHVSCFKGGRGHRRLGQHERQHLGMLCAGQHAYVSTKAWSPHLCCKLCTAAKIVDQKLQAAAHD